MEGFSIDDVRDTIGTDMIRLITRIEQATSGAELGQTLEASAFHAIGDAAHSIYGTSALVGAQSIAETAGSIQKLAELGRQELATAMTHLARARELALIAKEGAGEMRTMLALELDHQRQDASLVAREWQRRADQMLVPPSQLHPPMDVSDPIVVELREVFRQEALEIVTGVKRDLSALFANPADSTAARSLERLFHTLKGAAATVGRTRIAEGAARLQKMLQAVDDDGAAMNAELIDRVSAGASELFAEAELSIELSPPPKKIGLRHQVPEVLPELWNVFEEESAELLEKLDRELLALEESPEPRAILAALQPLYHTLKGVVNTVNLGPIGELLHRVEDVLEDLVESPAGPPTKALATVLFNIQNEVRRSVREAPSGSVEPPAAVLEEALAALLSAAPTEGAPGREASGPPASTAPKTADEDTRKYVRVRTERLDGLMDLAGELVVQRSRVLTRIQALRAVHAELSSGGKRLSETIETFSADHDAKRIGARGAGSGSNEALFSDLELDRYDDVHVLSRSVTEMNNELGERLRSFAAAYQSLTDDSESLGKLVAQLRTRVIQARMVPLETLTSQLRLTARDASQRAGREVRFAMHGGEVHLDKTIAEGLLGPLLHLVRNAIVHGIEPAEERRAREKAELGVVALSAREELGRIVLELSDDGRGLDLHALRAKGVAAGLIAPLVPLSDPAIKDLIFQPGLSTEGEAHAIAGRGFGCDVVRRSVEQMSGSVRVATVQGKGTTFTLTLPLTLTISRALFVHAGGQSFAVPLYFAERILDSSEQALVERDGIRFLPFEGTDLPITPISRLMGFEEATRPSGPLVVLRMGSERCVVQVDAVVSHEEVVVKSLGALLAGHPLFSGVTMRGSGELVLILDVPALISSLRTRARPLVQPHDAVPVEVEHEPARRCVLFVDDSLSVRRVAQQMFTALDVDVTFAIDGVDALAKMDGERFDLIFTDLEMPRMHGFELISQLRARDDARHVPIVVVTSRAGTKHRDHATSLGANEYLTKPFTAEALGAALERWNRPA